MFSLLVLLAACSGQRVIDDGLDSKQSKETPEVQRRTSIRMKLAVEYYQQGQHRSALEEIKQVLALAPNFADAYSLRALIQMDMNDPQRAEDNFLYALKLEPNNSDIANNYAWFLCQNGREKQSIPYFERVLKDRTYGTPIKAMINAGMCSLRAKDLAGGERFFLTAFEEQPLDPLINGNLAKISFDRANFEKAKFYIQRVLKEEVYAADVLWLAMKINNKLGDKDAVTSLSTQLRRRHPNSKEYALFQRGAFNE
jgi:type IV pilus assembly protein PilF